MATGVAISTERVKQNILQICDIRKDSQSDEIRVWHDGAIWDLIAVNGKYHYDCNR